MSTEAVVAISAFLFIAVALMTGFFAGYSAAKRAAQAKEGAE